MSGQESEPEPDLRAILHARLDAWIDAVDEQARRNGSDDGEHGDPGDFRVHVVVDDELSDVDGVTPYLRVEVEERRRFSCEGTATKR